MIWILIAAAALVGGLTQTVTGFGAGVVLMLALPLHFSIPDSAALTNAVCLVLSVSYVLRHRKWVKPSLVLLPAALYVLASTTLISRIKGMDIKALGVAFGVFLILLSLYSLLFARRVAIKRGLGATVGCSLISGVFSGLFAVGGPLMALYYLAYTDDKESYTANIQCMFSIANIVNLIARILNGIYTARMLPVTAAGVALILLGGGIGERIADRLNAEVMRKVIYTFIGVSGVLTLVKYLA